MPKGPIDVSVTGALPSGWTKKKVIDILRLAHRAAKTRATGVLSVKIVTDAEMKKLNKTWRGKDKTTDVLSFSYVGVIPGSLGDIAISMPQVRRQAKAIGRPVGDEFALMLVHGLLHVLGHDHETLAQEKKMFGLQHDILVNARIL